jgi:hypothetical protein
MSCDVCITNAHLQLFLLHYVVSANVDTFVGVFVWKEKRKKKIGKGGGQIERDAP